MSKLKMEAMSYVIHSYMCEDLGLNGSELLIFAIIRSFTKGEQRLFYGTHEYLSRVTGTSLRTVVRALKSLCDRGYVEAVDNNGRKAYKAVVTQKYEDRWSNYGPPNDAERKIVGTRQDSDITPAIVGNRINKKAPKYAFHQIGTSGLVGMTAEQYKRLLDLVGAEVLSVYINRLEKLINESGFKTYNAYKTIRRWIFDAAEV